MRRVSRRLFHKVTARPNVDAPGRTGRIGVCSWSADAHERDVAMVADHLRIDPQSVIGMAAWFRGTSSESLALRREPAPGELCNVSFLEPHPIVDLLVLGPSVRLYEGHLFHSLLQHCASLVEADGSIALMKWVAAGPRCGAGVSLDWVVPESLGNVTEDSRFFYGTPPSPQDEHDASIYDWYRERALLIAALATADRPGAAVPLTDLDIFRTEAARASCDGQTFVPVLDVSVEGTGAAPSQPELQRVENAGLLTGHKSAYLTAILTPLQERLGALDILDHGSASAAVPMELLMTPGLDVRSATAVEPSSGHLTLMADQYFYLQKQLSGRFFYFSSTADAYRYDDRYHVISFLGSLLFVDRAKVRDVLDRAWNALHPGGALIVFESTLDEASPSLAYYDKIFTVDELDELLGAYGEVVRYHPADVRVATRKEAGTKRVFRVVTKDG